MANPEHVEIVKQGDPAIAAWRLRHPDLRFDLSGAYLIDEHLVKLNLQDANLQDANLGGAILVEANLRGANLDGAYLSRANLSGAYLSDAHLVGASLVGANLRGADLAGANLNANLVSASLIETNLSGANLSGSLFWYTVLSTDLSEARGLSSIEHLGPSIVSVDTLQQSKNLPDEFLRGVGLPDEMIALYHSWRGAIQFYSCFISHSTADQAFADRLYADLQANGVRCYLATKDLRIGDRLRQQIDETIRLRDKLVVVLSEASLGSAWVEDEVETAFEKERQIGRDGLFPVMLDRAVLETEVAWAAKIRQRHIGDFTAWKDADAYGEQFDLLLRDLRAGQQP